MNIYYYECHITIEPVFDERLQKATELAKGQPTFYSKSAQKINQRQPFWNDKKPPADIKKVSPVVIDKSDPETLRQIKEYEQKRRNLWDDKQKWYETPSKKERLGP